MLNIEVFLSGRILLYVNVLLIGLVR